MIAALGMAAALVACASSGVPGPATLVVGQEVCRSCRMTISTTRTAAQIVAANEEPLFFDDIGCLRDYLRDHRIASPGAAAYVADHRTGAWIAARDATYVLVRGQDTPMGSHLLAFADGASRDAVAVAMAAHGRRMSAEELFHGTDPRGGGR
jgi:copper chaperone NosL